MAIAKCKICNREYDVCNTCESQKKLRPWRTVVDSVEHYKIYLALHGYTISKDKVRAKVALQNCDLSDLKNFNPEIKAVIKEIMAEPSKNKKVSSKGKRTKDNDIKNDIKEDVESDVE